MGKWSYGGNAETRAISKIFKCLSVFTLLPEGKIAQPLIVMFDQVVTGSSVVFFSGELDNDYFGSDAN
jgi:hypothetical protein